MDFYERLRELRKASGKTQVQVAAFLKITERQYQRLEAGGSKPHYDNLLALADCFGVSIDYLVCRTDNPRVN